MPDSDSITVLPRKTGEQLLHSTEQVPAFTFHRPTRNMVTGKKSLINAEVIEGYHVTDDEFLFVYHYPTQRESVGNAFFMVDRTHLTNVIVESIIPVTLPLFNDTTAEYGINRSITTEFLLTDYLGVEWLESALASHGVERTHVLTDNEFENLFEAPYAPVNISDSAVTQNTDVLYVVGYIPSITEIALLYQDNKIDAETAEEIINLSAKELHEIDVS